jgi:recombination protein RecA
MAKKEDRNTRESRLRELCAAINGGSFGGDEHDAVTWLGSRDAVSLERFPSGSPKLDEALGGGWPKGRFIEIFGPESGGKTTLVLHAIAEHQKKWPDEDIALIDSEYSFDEEYAAKLGVNAKWLVVNQPASGVQALNVMRELIKKGVKCLVVDSVAALTTQAEMDGDLGDQQVADQARMMSRALRTLTTEAGQRKVTIFFTNQVREKIGVMYGDRTTTPAGRALKHYASIRVQISKIGTVKDKIDGEDVVVSAKTKADVKKNKTAPPFMRAEFCISFGHGIDYVAEVVDTAIEMKVIEKRGSWFNLNGEQLAAGRMAVLEMMRKDPEYLKKLEVAMDKAKAEAEAAAGAAGEAKTGGFEPKRASFSKKAPKPEALEGEEPAEMPEDGAEVKDA